MRDLEQALLPDMSELVQQSDSDLSVASLPQTPSRLTAGRLRSLATVATYADSSSERAALEVVAPFTGDVFASLPLGREEDVLEACRRARDAQAMWAAKPYSERAEVFKRYHDRVLNKHEEALDLIQLEKR